MTNELEHRGAARGKWAAALSLGLLLGCGSREKPAEEAKVEETGKEVSKNPLTAIQQFGEAAQKVGEKMEAAAKRAPVEPVKYDVLLPFLPKPAGFQSEEPQGSTTSMGEFKVTVVSASYTAEKPARAEGAEEDPNAPPPARVHVEITDGGYVPALYAPFQMMAQFSHESTEGYQKGITLEGGHPGVESWNKDSKASELTVLVADRYLVHLKGEDGVEPATLRAWLGQMRLGELAALK